MVIVAYGKSRGGWGHGPYYDYGSEPTNATRHGTLVLNHAGDNINEVDVTVACALVPADWAKTEGRRTYNPADWKVYWKD